MELSTEMIMEIALNAAGYLSAGLLSVVIYTMFRRKTAVVSAEVSDRRKEQSLANSEELTQPTDNNTRTVFVPLNEGNIAAPNTSNARRNRGEVIRLARQMLNSGTSGEQVQQLLPITKGELAILTTDN